MPNPSKNENEQEYISRCIPEVINDGTAEDETQAYAICKSKWDNQSSIQSEPYMRVKELYIDTETCKDGCSVQAISMVDSPAIEIDFMCFAKNIVKEKKIVTGPAMVPDKLIYRYDEITGEEYYIYFTKDTIKEIAEKYLMDHLQSNVTIQHEVTVDDICLIESWIVEDKQHDKSTTLGYDVPLGTWMVSMKVNNDAVWNDVVKTGIVKGFSIEGYFSERFNKEVKPSEDMIVNEILNILNSIDED